MLSDIQNLSYSIFATKVKYLGSDIVAEADEVGKFSFGKVAGKNDFDTATTKVAGLHHTFVFPF